MTFGTSLIFREFCTDGRGDDHSKRKRRKNNALCFIDLRWKKKGGGEFKGPNETSKLSVVSFAFFPFSSQIDYEINYLFVQCNN